MCLHGDLWVRDPDDRHLQNHKEEMEEEQRTRRTGKLHKLSKARVRQLQAILALVLMVFFGFSLLYFTWKIVDYFVDARKGQNYAEDLRDLAVVMDETEPDWEMADSETEEGEIEIPAYIDFDSLHEISEDAIAWLYAPGTKIDYVVAQAEDNDYYMYRLLDGTAAKCGTLFADFRSSDDFTDWNTLIYGHHMKNGTMFAGLMDYRDPEFYEEHPVMYLYVPGKRYKLELIAGYTTNVEDKVFSVPATRKDRDEILDHAYRTSSFISGIKAGGEDKLVTLSTCSYVYTDARYVVIGRIVEE